MKQKLDGHQMTPPAGLWEDISQQMGLESKPAPKVTFMRRYYWAAAAVVLAIVGFFAFYQFDNDQGQPQLAAHNKPTSATQTVDEAQPSVSAEQPTPTIPVHAATSKPTLLAHTPITPQQEMNKAETAEAEPQQEVVETSQEVAENTQEVAEASQKSSDVSPMVASSHQKQTYLPDVSQHYATSSKSDDSDKWAIGLSGSNGLLMAASNSIETSSAILHGVNFINNPVPDTYSNNTNFVDSKTHTVPDVVYKHHIPVRFGLSLQYHLNNRLSLLSGISYTYLKSEISSQLFNNQSYKQALSYLGIPVGLSWKVWSSQNFQVYLAGSTLLEKCVDASITDGDISQRPWQWSVNASAGAEYIVMRQFGLYLEPSLGYYFNDGSSLQHYYKEHPLVPSVLFGLRLHLK